GKSRNWKREKQNCWRCCIHKNVQPGSSPTTLPRIPPMTQTLLAMAKDLVMAQIEAHRLSPDDMHTALQQTYASLKALQAQEDANGLVAGEAPKTPPERVNWKKSI